MNFMLNRQSNDPTVTFIETYAFVEIYFGKPVITKRSYCQSMQMSIYSFKQMNKITTVTKFDSNLNSFQAERDSILDC